MMKCQLTSIAYQKVMINTDLKSDTYKEICWEEKRIVNLGYNNYRNFFKVENNQLQQYPPHSGLQTRGELPQMVYDWEVLPGF